MEKLKKLINCMEASIKKNFFNIRKNDISQDCERILNVKTDEENEVDEYLNNYKSTTRWQTV